MRLLATADLHGSLPEIEPCDVLIIAGDVAPDFHWTGEIRQASWLDTHFRTWLEEIPAERIVGIAGNHDFVFEHPELVPENLPWTYLEDSGVEIEGIRFYGYPWVPNLPSWAFHLSDDDLLRTYDEVPECEVLISHGPPFLAGDRLDNGLHVGCGALNLNLPRIDPKVVICGHIHEGFGEYTVKNYPILNVAHNDVRYRPVNPVIDISGYI